MPHYHQRRGSDSTDIDESDLEKRPILFSMDPGPSRENQYKPPAETPEPTKRQRIGKRFFQICYAVLIIAVPMVCACLIAFKDKQVCKNSDVGPRVAALCLTGVGAWIATLIELFGEKYIPEKGLRYWSEKVAGLVSAYVLCTIIATIIVRGCTMPDLNPGMNNATIDACKDACMYVCNASMNAATPLLTINY